MFLTGVSKFSKTSIFSGINNLTDITIDERYANMLGYTHKELKCSFDGYLNELAYARGKGVPETIADVTEYYDGYMFCEKTEKVFNPYSVMRCFGTKKLNNYWFETGTPTFLIQLLQKNQYDLESITEPTLNEGSLGSFEPDKVPLSSLLLQTGYLTIKAYDQNTHNYTLGIPNKEVYNGLTLQLVDAYTLLPPDKSVQYARAITHAFMAKNIKELQDKLQEFFNRAPYVVQIAEESQLQFVLYSIFALMGVMVNPEVMTSRGRADLIVELPKLVYIIELKFDGTAKKALEQINEKQYYKKFIGTDKQIVLLGINFEHKTKRISLAAQNIE